MTNAIDVWPSGATWAYRGTLTQSNAGGGNGVITIIPGAGSEFMLIWVHLGPNDYAAARTVTVRVEDTDNNRIMDIYSAAIDNVHVNLPITNSDSVASALNKSGFPFMISGTDILHFDAASLAQNETFTIAIRARLKGKIPTIATTGSTGTVALVADYNTVL